ncbi:hypothetical protein [Burkholderia lata]|uniref:hypothetical protein n=1 Tax=Burkholderia lata (strain ATCC 17760 / DSM 23089 / LMG 22485 / NCIMB 9086 / R18194 / 383) TaxID=482957 RepID=UPI001582B4DF|nr:hypothetical protein [Burkholderia lata]
MQRRYAHRASHAFLHRPMIVMPLSRKGRARARPFSLWLRPHGGRNAARSVASAQKNAEKLVTL